jgi:hypothetical protein
VDGNISAPGNTLVVGVPAGFVPLKTGKAVEKASDAKEE